MALLIKRMDDVWKAREIENKYRIYCLSSILELNKQVMALRLIEPDQGHINEPEYDYTDECMEPAPARIDGYGGCINVSVPRPKERAVTMFDVKKSRRKTVKNSSLKFGSF